MLTNMMEVMIQLDTVLINNNNVMTYVVIRRFLVDLL